jgi:hypothetical protein
MFEFSLGEIEIDTHTHIASEINIRFKCGELTVITLSSATVLFISSYSLTIFIHLLAKLNLCRRVQYVHKCGSGEK